MIKTKSTKYLKIPKIIFGTNQLFSKATLKRNLTVDFQIKKIIDILNHAYKEGIMGYDTAEEYYFGLSESILGRFIKDKKRSDLFIISKVSPKNLRYEDVIDSCKESLKRLNTNYIDLYLIHSPNENIPIRETMRALSYLKENKYVRDIGVSNFDVKQIKEAQKHTKHKIVVNQVRMSVYNRRYIFNGMLNFCQENDIILMAYQPLDCGNIFRKKDFFIKQVFTRFKYLKAPLYLQWVLDKKNAVVVTRSLNKYHLRELISHTDRALSNEIKIFIDLSYLYYFMSKVKRKIYEIFT